MLFCLRFFSPSLSSTARALPDAITSRDGRIEESPARIFALLISNCSTSFSEKISIALSWDIRLKADRTGLSDSTRSVHW